MPYATCHMLAADLVSLTRSGFDSLDLLRSTRKVIVWDVDLLCAAKACSKGGTGAGLALLARQISDFPITRMVFSPFEKQVRRRNSRCEWGPFAQSRGIGADRIILCPRNNTKGFEKEGAE